jgi:hypothetical protein
MNNQHSTDGAFDALQIPPMSGELIEAWARQNYDFQVAQYDENVKRARALIQDEEAKNALDKSKAA